MCPIHAEISIMPLIIQFFFFLKKNLKKKRTKENTSEKIIKIMADDIF